MPDEQGESRTITVSRPTTSPKPDAQVPRVESGETMDQAAAPAQPRTILVAAGIVALLFAVLLVFLADGGKAAPTARATETASPQATATLSPTATPDAATTALPEPTPMSGFKVYVDSQGNFLLQYPEGWAPSPLSGEVDFQDTANADISFEMFVLTPDPGLLPSQTSDAQTAGAWVDHVLNTESQLHAGAFVRIPGPMPSGSFADSDWQIGEGLLGDGTTQVRIRVYVTIHDGNPYVIGIAAADPSFDFANEDYFTPMLQSFAFLPSNP